MPSAVSETGRKLRDLPVETNGQALVDAVQMMPGHKHRGFEEDLQSAWLYETLKPHVDDVAVAGITESRGMRSSTRPQRGHSDLHGPPCLGRPLESL